MEHVWNNNTDLDIGPGDDQVARSSICTYNGVEYLEVREEYLTLKLSDYSHIQGEEVFTQRRCQDCVCRNGEIRCETVDCENDDGGEECDGPDYLCPTSGNISS